MFRRIHNFMNVNKRRGDSARREQGGKKAERICEVTKNKSKNEEN